MSGGSASVKIYENVWIFTKWGNYRKPIQDPKFSRGSSCILNLTWFVTLIMRTIIIHVKPIRQLFASIICGIIDTKMGIKYRILSLYPIIGFSDAQQRPAWLVRLHRSAGDTNKFSDMLTSSIEMNIVVASRSGTVNCKMILIPAHVLKSRPTRYHWLTHSLT